MMYAYDKMAKGRRLNLVSQEIAFAKNLASNDLRQRDKAVKRLRKWLQNQYANTKSAELALEDMMRIWKGLFYCMWMSDKLLVQEDLAEYVSNLVHVFGNHTKAALTFVKAFFATMRNEWSSIDTNRLNKFQMLVRRMLRHSLLFVAQDKWSTAPQFGEILWSEVLSADQNKLPPLGLGLHICEIFLEEVAKVVNHARVTQKALISLLQPFGKCIASKTADTRLRSTVNTQIFGYLMRQSDPGLDHQHRLQTWIQLGCPAIQLDELERVEVDEDSDSETVENLHSSEGVLDPRAGQVDVELSQIPFDPNKIAAFLRQLMTLPDVNGKAKRRLRHLAEKFDVLATNKYPLKFNVPIAENEDLNDWDSEEDVKTATSDLDKFELRLQQEEVTMGVAKPSVVKRIKALEAAASIKTRQRKRRRKSTWKVTVIEESNKTKKRERSLPGNVGQWEVSPVVESSSKKAPGEWEKPLQDGEYEYFVEVKKSKSPKNAESSPSSQVIKCKEQQHSKVQPVKRKKQQNGVIPGRRKSGKKQKLDNTTEKVVKSAEKLAANEKSFTTPKRTPTSVLQNLTPGCSSSKSSKRVEFELKRNMFQDVSEYTQQLRNSPGIPHDPNKQPTQGLLKKESLLQHVMFYQQSPLSGKRSCRKIKL